MAWFAKKQVEIVVDRAHERVGSGWSWMAKAMKEAVIAREVCMYLAEQPVTDGLVRMYEVNDLFEACFEHAGLRRHKVNKTGRSAMSRLLSARRS